jgi:hypothetical protein
MSSKKENQHGLVPLPNGRYKSVPKESVASTEIWRSGVAVCLAALISCSSTVMAQSPESPVVLSATQQQFLRDVVLTPVLRVGDLASPVKEALRALFKERAFAMAEPDAEFQVTDVVMKQGLPFRRLIIAACSADRCLVHYERGGIAHVYNVALFALTSGAATFEWGGLIRGRVSDLSALREQVLNGAVDTRVFFW